VFKKQLRAFVNDTGWVGIFKKNLTNINRRGGESEAIVGEESLGVTKSGQLVKIRFDGKMLELET